jgi:hypothetical protein
MNRITLYYINSYGDITLMQGPCHLARCDCCWLLLSLVLNALCALVYWYHSVPVKRRLSPGPSCISFPVVLTVCWFHFLWLAWLVPTLPFCCSLKCVMIRFWCCSIMNWDIMLVYWALLCMICKLHQNPSLLLILVWCTLSRTKL